MELSTLRMFRPESIQSNLSLIKKYFPASDQVELTTWDCLKRLMHADLDSLARDTEDPQLLFYESNTQILTKALTTLMGHELPPDVSYSELEKEIHSQKYHEAIQYISETYPETYGVFKELISFIIIGRKVGYGGGTVSSRIGLIWLSPQPEWTIFEWGENLIHEFIHNVIFLEDMVNTIFIENTKRMADPDALALSAIRKESRGLDKSYHSAFVSFVIIEFHKKLKNDNRISELLDPLILCIGDLIEKTMFLTPNANRHLSELADEVLKIKKSFQLQSVQN